MRRARGESYERVVRYPLGRAPRWDHEYDDELSEIRRTPMFGHGRPMFDDDFDVPAGLPRRRFRQAAWRFIGAVAIGGAFWGIAQIAVHPDARREIAAWVTLGHPEKVEGAERTVRRWVEWIRQW